MNTITVVVPEYFVWLLLLIFFLHAVEFLAKTYVHYLTGKLEKLKAKKD